MRSTSHVKALFLGNFCGFCSRYFLNLYVDLLLASNRYFDIFEKDKKIPLNRLLTQ